LWVNVGVPVVLQELGGVQKVGEVGGIKERNFRWDSGGLGEHVFVFLTGPKRAPSTGNANAKNRGRTYGETCDLKKNENWEGGKSWKKRGGGMRGQRGIERLKPSR